MELLLIRHALPLRIENSDGSPADPALSEIGQEQARQLAHGLRGEKLDVLYASPLRRAHETALPLAHAAGLEIELEPGVREFDPDAATYIPMEELKETDYERWRELVQGGFEQAADFGDFSRGVVAALVASGPLLCTARKQVHRDLVIEHRCTSLIFTRLIAKRHEYDHPLPGPG